MLIHILAKAVASAAALVATAVVELAVQELTERSGYVL